MIKGLISKRVHLPVGNQLDVTSALRQLGVEEKAVKLKLAWVIDVHLTVRANLPLEIRQAIFKWMDQRSSGI